MVVCETLAEAARVPGVVEILASTPPVAYVSGDVRPVHPAQPPPLVGDGETDDTAAMKAALGTGEHFRGRIGATYLVDGGLQLTGRGQRMDLTGCVLKRRAGSGPFVRVTGEGAGVVGGVIDSSNVAQASIAVGANGGYVGGVTLCNNGSAAIYGYNNASGLRIRGNIIKDAVTYGIYVEGLTADCYDNRIEGNAVDVSAADGACGIYLTGANDESAHQRQWVIQQNRVVGSRSNVAAGITARAIDGVCCWNQVSGFLLQVSADIAEGCIIAHNRCAESADGDSYGIEVNGPRNIISDNFIRGANRAIAASGRDEMDGMSIRGNVIENPKSFGVFVQATASGKATSLNISGNTICVEGAATAIRLVRDCKRAHISSNRLVGPGSGVSGAWAIYLDSVNGDVSIVANRMSGWSGAVGLYNASAVAQHRVSLLANDLTDDMPAETAWLSLQGKATAGSALVKSGNAPTA